MDGGTLPTCTHTVQDVSGGKPVRIQGTDLPIYGMEIDVAAAAEEIRSIGKESDGTQVRPHALKNSCSLLARFDLSP